MERISWVQASRRPEFKRLESKSPESKRLGVQGHWQLETTNSRFWLVNILLRKFGTAW